MKLTYYGHACVGIQIGEIHLLFDPFISPNPLASHIDISTIPADYILVSHGHYDHVADVEAIAKRTGATIISNFEIVEWFKKQGIENGHGMNIGGQHTFDFGAVKMVSATHSSSLPDGSYGGNPSGFVITIEGNSFYFSGDTGLNYDMRLIGEQFHISFAILCIGDNFTMGAHDAQIASEFIRCEDIIGIHYDTFDPIKIDHEKAKKIFTRKGKVLRLLAIGEEIMLK